MTPQELTAAILDLELWFASRPYGWRERATPNELEQWEARSLELDRLYEIRDAK